MTTTPALDAAIRAGCEAAHGPCSVCEHPAVDCPGDLMRAIPAALRSLATPTPEVIEAMAIEMLRNQFGRMRRHSFDETVWPTDVELDNARAAHAALWAHILGDAT